MPNATWQLTRGCARAWLPRGAKSPRIFVVPHGHRGTHETSTHYLGGKGGQGALRAPRPVKEVVTYSWLHLAAGNQVAARPARCPASIAVPRLCANPPAEHVLQLWCSARALQPAQPLSIGSLHATATRRPGHEDGTAPPASLLLLLLLLSLLSSHVGFHMRPRLPWQVTTGGGERARCGAASPEANGGSVPARVSASGCRCEHDDMQSVGPTSWPSAIFAVTY